jgi:hypothetical protein
MRLHQGSDDIPIVCSLQVVSLDDNPIYETLSYVWGDPTHPKSIIVGGESFNVTENLFSFLRHLRMQNADRFLWADAICIDQRNETEKICQLGLMSRIYRQAKEAHIWFGDFSDKWSDEIKSQSKHYVRASDILPCDWEALESFWLGKLAGFVSAGGDPDRANLLPGSRREYGDKVLLQTLAVLDWAATGKHLYEFPLFLVTQDVGHSRSYTMNKHWLTIIDCMRWLLSRPWWTRVWTLQEAILPEVDPIVHTPPYSFRLSSILNGMKSIFDHRATCCKDQWHLFLGECMLDLVEQSADWFSYATTLQTHRNRFATSESRWLSLGEAIYATQERNATDIGDHFFGVLGLLPAEWQQGWQFQEENLRPTASEIFSQCTKLLFTNDSSLDSLGDAIGMRESKLTNLPSWAIDLSNRLPESEDGSKRWALYKACHESRYKGARLMAELEGPILLADAIFIGTLDICAPQVFKDDLIPDRLITHVSEWWRIYHSCAQPANADKFWRAAFMDRNIQRYWLHNRRPLPGKNLSSIKKWWLAWKKTGDECDLDEDSQSRDGSPGDYHYRALKMNAQKQRFFCTAKREPGLGPHDLAPTDLIYVLGGCSAPAVLRRSKRGGRDSFVFVGLCFVDGWMYGEATFGKPKWQTLEVY